MYVPTLREYLPEYSSQTTKHYFNLARLDRCPIQPHTMPMHAQPKVHSRCSEQCEIIPPGILPESILIPLLLLMAPDIKIQNDICRASGTGSIMPFFLILSLTGALQYRLRARWRTLLFFANPHIAAVAAQLALGWYSFSDSGLER